MQFSQLPYTERQELYQLYSSGADLYEHALARGWKLSSLERRLREFGAGQVKESPKPRLDKPPAIGDCLILADPHVPYHDAAFVNWCIDKALAAKVEHCCIAGDFLDYDALSPFDGDVRNILGDEFEAGEAFLAVLAKAFKSVLCIMGNHDRRMAKRLGYHQLPEERIGRMLTASANVTWTQYYHATCGTWRICHPKNASSTPGSVAGKLASKYRCNIVAGHGHLFGVAQDTTAEFVGIDSGACVDPARLEYVEARMNTRPRICQGAVILKDGLPILLNKHFMRG